MNHVAVGAVCGCVGMCRLSGDIGCALLLMCDWEWEWEWCDEAGMMMACGRPVPAPGRGGGDGDEMDMRFLEPRWEGRSGATEVRVRERERETPAEEGERRLEGAGSGRVAGAEPGMKECSVFSMLGWCMPRARACVCECDPGLNGWNSTNMSRLCGDSPSS